MKTLRYLMTVIALATVTASYAQYAEDPTFNFQSTSTMVSSGSSLPSAAETGVITTYDESNTEGSGRTARKVGPNKPGGPGAIPVGNGVGILLLLAAGYGISLGVRNLRRREGQFIVQRL